MEIHHTKHHQAYTDKLNKAAEAKPELKDKSIEEILAGIDGQDATLRNNAGGYWNHNFFFEIIGPGAGGVPEGELMQAIEKSFGTFPDFQKQFEEAAAGIFGSGWAWLIVQNKELKIVKTPLQDNPLMFITPEKGTPILGLDVWEHAYYLKYQNKRPEYITAFWSVVDWKEVDKKFILAL